MSPAIELKVLDPRLHEWGLPRHQSTMAAAIDLFACIDAPLYIRPEHPATLVPAGFSVHIGDPNIAALIVPRSGLGHRDGLVMGNLVGLIDADYVGPIMVSAWNRNAPDPESPGITISPGDRIAQMLFVPIVRPRFRVVSEFSQETSRGDGGFGSTGRA